MGEPMNRRTVLATSATIALSGCGLFQGERSHSDTRNIREVVVTNRRSQPVTLGVRIENEDGDAIFSKVYELAVDEYDSGAELDDAVPSKVFAFTPDGDSQEWEYGSPTKSDCNAPDVMIAVEEDQGMGMEKPC